MYRRPRLIECAIFRRKNEGEAQRRRALCVGHCLNGFITDLTRRGSPRGARVRSLTLRSRVNFRNDGKNTTQVGAAGSRNLDLAIALPRSVMGDRSLHCAYRNDPLPPSLPSICDLTPSSWSCPSADHLRAGFLISAVP